MGQAPTSQARPRDTEHLRTALKLGSEDSQGRFKRAKFFQKNSEVPIFGTCTQAFLQTFSEYLEQNRARKFSTGGFQILEPISTFLNYPYEGRHG